MELALGAMGTLAPKLAGLLQDKFVVQMGLEREIESLCRELPIMAAALVEVSRVPPGQLSDLEKLWAQEVRELSYDMEDAVDSFMVRVACGEPAYANVANIFKNVACKIAAAMKKVRDRHQISGKIKDIKDLSKELSELRARYTFRGTTHHTYTDRLDPRVVNLYKNKGRELIGIEKAKDELHQMLTCPEDKKSLKVIAIVGSGGLGKTTLAEVVHDQLQAQSFDCSAFVSVGRNPNIASTLREMLEKLDLDKKFSSDMLAGWNGERFCEELHKFLQHKRYNIVVDDVWQKETWETISCALPDSNCGSKVIMTTRNAQVSAKANDVYKIQPLCPEKSKELFYKRTSRMNEDEKSVVKIIGKCDGVPLSIIAIASLLVDRPLKDWETVYDSLIFGCGEDKTRTILLYSYYDLPPYLKPCLLYLSMYPEDHLINKSTLIWRWIAEGFVQPQQEGRGSLPEIGERYFNELLDRSMIQPVEIGRAGIIDGCRVHDIVLDLIRDLSTEENFVTVLVKKQFVSSHSLARVKRIGLHGFKRKMRRLSIQWSNGQSIPQDHIGVPEVVRSLHCIDCVIDVLSLCSFQACRVLSMTRRSKIGDLKHLGMLLHLRYLEINDDDELPRQIGNLKSLQTLIINARMRELPPAVFELTQLICLHATGVSKMPVDTMGNLVCLEELDLHIIEVDDFVVGLGKLTRLRVLKITCIEVKKTSYKALMQSLNNLREIRELKIWPWYSGNRLAWESWEPSQQLWSLATNMGLSPPLIDPLQFRCIQYLCVSIEDVEVDMGNLALLRELLYLELQVVNKYHQGFIVGANGFENLRVCKAGTKFKFLQRAMPRLESLRFMICPQSYLDLNLVALLSLKEVIVKVNCIDYFRADVEETVDMLRRAVEGHPNRPTLHISRFCERDMLPDDQMKPYKVVSVHLNAWGCRWDKGNGISDIVNMRLYRWLEEINCNIDCRGSNLSKVQEIEANLRYQAARHPKHPKLVIKRIKD